MRLYRLKLNISLVDMGEAPEEEPKQEERHPMLQDPMDRQEKMVDRLVGMAEMVGAAAERSHGGSGNTIGISESYDVPAQTFEDAMAVLKRFNDLANLVGTPSASGVPILGHGLIPFRG